MSWMDGRTDEEFDSCEAEWRRAFFRCAASIFCGGRWNLCFQVGLWCHWDLLLKASPRSCIVVRNLSSHFVYDSCEAGK